MSEDMIRREALAELLPSGDGRTIDVRIIPYHTISRVSDNGRDFYDEEWQPGAFESQLNAANRVEVLANFEHQQGISGVIARGTELRDTDAALEGTFRMLTHSDADKALELVNEGVLTGISVEAIPLKSVNKDGIVQRVKARLVNIAFCRMPAFADAQVLAVREKADEPDEPDEPFEAPGVDPPNEQEIIEEGPPTPPPPVERTDIADVLQRVGYEPLVARAVVRTPWDGSASRFTDEQYQRSCLIDRGGDGPVKERCSLPVLEPNGDVNANALATAAGRIGQVMASADQKAAAARKLLRYYRQAKQDPPPALVSLAAR